MFGNIELNNFKTAELNQKAASAWSAVEGLVGASYKPVLYVGSQLVNGVNHWFIAEITLSTATTSKRLVTLAVNENGGDFKLIPHSIKDIYFSV